MINAIYHKIFWEHFRIRYS